MHHPRGAALAQPDSDLGGLPIAVSLKRRLVFKFPAMPGREAVEMSLFASDGTLVKRSRYRMAPVALDATFLPPGPYLAEFRWWNGKRDRLEKVPLSL
ncbi:MAG: hypothetical protein ABIW76_11175 [Fibrobacteria bacterium]